MTTYYKLEHYGPGYYSQMLARANGTWVKRADYEADLAAARAEIERLTKVRDNLSRLEQSHREQANEQFHRAEKAEAENQRLREAVAEEWREIEQAHQPRLADGYTAVRISKPGFWLVKGPGPRRPVQRGGQP